MSSLYGSLSIVQLLLSHPKLDINAGSKTALCEACQLGNVATVTCLLSHPNIDVNKGGNQSGTPLYISCVSGALSIVKLLLEKPAIDVNRGGFGFTPLYAACEWNHSEVVRELLLHPQIDVNKGNQLPIDVACSNKFEYIAIRLMLAGSQLPRDPKHQEFILTLQANMHSKRIQDACR